MPFIAKQVFGYDTNNTGPQDIVHIIPINLNRQMAG